MDDERRMYDVWLVRSERVYQGVPYEVVADWLTQGRMAPGDKVRRPGRDDHWRSVEKSKKLSPYIPRPGGPTSPADAYEPVELDLAIPRRPGDEDDDVDMIPLIDISLVLLIFFMMTSAVGGGLLIDVPQTQYATALAGEPTHYVIAVDRKPDGKPSYALAQGDAAPAEGDRDLSEAVVLARLDARLRGREPGRGVVVRVAGHKKLPFDVMERLGTELNKRRSQGITEVKTDVGEKAR